MFFFQPSPSPFPRQHTRPQPLSTASSKVQWVGSVLQPLAFCSAIQRNKNHILIHFIVYYHLLLTRIVIYLTFYNLRGCVSKESAPCLFCESKFLMRFIVILLTCTSAFLNVAFLHFLAITGFIVISQTLPSPPLPSSPRMLICSRKGLGTRLV